MQTNDFKKIESVLLEMLQPGKGKMAEMKNQTVQTARLIEMMKTEDSLNFF